MEFTQEIISSNATQKRVNIPDSPTSMIVTLDKDHRRLTGACTVSPNVTVVLNHMKKKGKFRYSYDLDEAGRTYVSRALRNYINCVETMLASSSDEHHEECCTMEICRMKDYIENL